MAGKPETQVGVMQLDIQQIPRKSSLHCMWLTNWKH